MFVQGLSRSKQVTKIKTIDIRNEEFIISQTKLKYLETHECHKMVRNNEALCIVLNSSESKLQFDIFKAIATV